MMMTTVNWRLIAPLDVNADHEMECSGRKAKLRFHKGRHSTAAGAQTHWSGRDRICWLLLEKIHLHLSEDTLDTAAAGSFL